MWQSMITYITLTAILIQNCDGCQWCTPPNIKTCGITDGNGWTLVRAIGPTTGAWFDNTDALQGTDPAVDNNKDKFNIGSFSNAVQGFNQFLFVTGDCSLWLITSKNAIGGPFNGQYYSNGQRSICASSERATPYTAGWYNRQPVSSHRQDPWISTVDHSDAWGSARQIYVEGNHPYPVSVIDKKNGVYVYIRNAGKLDSNGCATDPCANKTCDNGIYCDGEEYCDPIDAQCKSGVSVSCPENMLCSNDDATCVRDCKSFAFDEYLTQCSAKWKSNQVDIANLRNDISNTEQRLDDADGNLLNMVETSVSNLTQTITANRKAIEGEIARLHNRINGFKTYTPAKAEGLNNFGSNHDVGAESGYFDGYKDVLIIGLLLMNMLTMTISCYMYCKNNAHKYRIVTGQESDDERIVFKQ